MIKVVSGSSALLRSRQSVAVFAVSRAILSDYL